ncbi:Gfo/Idh/MocA family protein [Stieleria varia]|uniref:Oxidoreductase family, NAD-binding Rossmann fold n=1 Tax=Stieleria varia TaxID=2528005 RepID=A0A5C6B776_9BACT|nr:Gfo/Idh/MocA family oxidoreductase [Stieleria varia]TWU06344.1 Oxidoreductase family, NAD-binding Rossmann fold [Stieleria varia]
MKLRLGLIGLGDHWQSRYLPALRVLHDRFDVRAVYSTVAKLSENTAAEFQADPVDGYRSLVSRCDIDAVMILKPCWLGWLPALAACEAGKAVYWAGGLDFDPAQAESVRQSIQQSGVSFMTELPRRFSPATLRLKELIATRLGAPKLLFAHRRLPAAENQRSGASDSSRSKSELVELIDWCQYVVGRAPTAVSSSRYGDDDHEEYWRLSLQFPSAEHGGKSLPPVNAQVSCGSYMPAQWSEAANFRPPAALQVCCERGIAFIDLPATLVWFDEAGRHVEALETELPVGQQLLTQFHRSVTSLVRSIGGLEDTFRAARVLAAANQSELEGRRVDVE